MWRTTMAAARQTCAIDALFPIVFQSRTGRKLSSLQAVPRSPMSQSPILHQQHHPTLQEALGVVSTCGKYCEQWVQTSCTLNLPLCRGQKNLNVVEECFFVVTTYLNYGTSPLQRKVGGGPTLHRISGWLSEKIHACVQIAFPNMQGFFWQPTWKSV